MTVPPEMVTVPPEPAAEAPVATPAATPSGWPPGPVGRWLRVSMMVLATVGGAGVGLAALAGVVRGDGSRVVAERLDELSGRLVQLEAAQRTTSERLIELRATVEAREQSRREQLELVDGYLRQRPAPDVKRAREALAE